MATSLLQVQRTKEANTKHGKKGTRIYRIWVGMMTRCFNERNKDYPNYGGRGIRVCHKWQDFIGFYEDMGEPPSLLHTLDRRDNSKGYNKQNCRWSTVREQAHNRRSTVLITFRGVIKPACLWDEELNFFPGTVAKRIRKGWSVEEAVTIPINPNLSRNQKKE